MKLTKILASTAVAGTCFLGCISQVEAANLTNSWDVLEAESSQYNGSGGHAFWLPEQINGGVFVVDGGATFNEYDDGTAHMFGSIVGENDATKTWDFDIWFESTEMGSGGPKKELASGAYVNNNGTVDTNTWKYYDFSSTKDSVLTSDSGAYAGDTITLSDITNGKYPMQMGYGANGKNTGMGLSTWFKYDGDKNSTRNSDINISLVAKGSGNSAVNTAGTPEPLTILGSAAALGFGALFKKKHGKKQK